MLVKYLLYAFVIYLLYKFIFDLVIPVSKATSQVKDKLREMQEQQSQQHFQQQKPNPARTQQPQAEPEKKGGDYIDFEEVK